MLQLIILIHHHSKELRFLDDDDNDGNKSNNRKPDSLLLLDIPALKTLPSSSTATTSLASPHQPSSLLSFTNNE
jgi:hypothetical protein